MSKLVFCSTLGLSGLLLTLIAQGCSNSSSTPSGGNDSGVVSDTGTGTQTQNDTGTGTSGDTGTGTGADTGTGTQADTGSPSTLDAGPWTPSNFDPTAAAIANILTPTPPIVDMTGGCSVDTDQGTVSCDDGAVGPDGGNPTVPYAPVTLSGAGGTATIFAMASFTLEAGQSLQITGSKVAIFYVLGDVQIDGKITVLAGAQTGGSGGGASPGNTTSFGAGGGGYCGIGGAGAPALEDAGGGTSTGGAVNGNAILVPLLGGASGGQDSNTTAGGGQAGGGALQITALGNLVITSGAWIIAPGQGGGTDDQSSSGPGSGGAILLEAPSVAIAGTLAVNGGGGSDPTSSAQGPQSGQASTSQADNQGNGGPGGAGTILAGGNAGPNSAGTNATGGGGVGYIRINTANAQLSGIFSPDLGDAGGGCTTVGPLP